MALFKCKMCGGDLTAGEGSNVAVCEYCGTSQTVPSGNDEKKIQVFNRANKLRLDCEFDKAAGLYESIIADFPKDSEAYWGLVLCKYGVEYVEDPDSHERIPTVHRARYQLITNDGDYKSALENADTYQKTIYEKEAERIETIQNGILDISKTEEPYDVFICYKETDNVGQRTEDSVLAYDIYERLTEKGYRVFFSRVTLDDKLGQEFEPYIFSALNSAKVMLVVGTKAEYFNAVWVKNEWSRFLEITSKDKSKVIIPCYKDMNPSDLPEELGRLQSQDMNKLGSMQDVLTVVNKIIGGDKPSATGQQAEGDFSKNYVKKSNSKIIIAVVAVIVLAVLGIVGRSVLSGKKSDEKLSVQTPVSSKETNAVETTVSNAVPNEEEVKQRFIEFFKLCHKWFFEASVEIDYENKLGEDKVVWGNDYSTTHLMEIYPVKDDKVKTMYDLDSLFLSYCTEEVYKSMSHPFGWYTAYDGILCVEVTTEPMGYETDERLIESSIEVIKNSDDDFTVNYMEMVNLGTEGIPSYSVHYTKTTDGYRFGKAYDNRQSGALESGNHKVTTKGSDLTVRALPEKDAEKVGSLPNGHVVNVYNSTKQWAYIEYYTSDRQFISGWVSVDYLQPTTEKYTKYLD